VSLGLRVETDRLYQIAIAMIDPDRFVVVLAEPAALSAITNCDQPEELCVTRID